MITELFLKLRKCLDNQNDGKRKVFLDLLDLINLGGVKRQNCKNCVAVQSQCSFAFSRIIPLNEIFSFVQ